MGGTPPDGVSRRAFLAGVGLTGSVALAGCTQATASGFGDGLTGSLDISGSSTVFPLAREMRKRFLDEHPRVSISLMSTGSGGGFQNHFCPGDTDFNNASRPIQQVEEDLCSGNGIEPVELKVATDALTIIVNEDNDWVDCITVEELKEMWSVETAPSTWSEINSEWPDEELSLFGPTGASGTFDYFHEAILEGTDSRRDYLATEKDRQIMQGVQGNQYAIGYMGFAYYTKNSESVKALAVDDGDGCVRPSLETAMNGEYTPLSRPLFTYPAKRSLARDEVAAFARYFVENSTSEEIVADAVGYVPNDEETKEQMLDRLETAIAEANEEVDRQ